MEKPRGCEFEDEPRTEAIEQFFFFFKLCLSLIGYTLDEHQLCLVTGEQDEIWKRGC